MSDKKQTNLYKVISNPIRIQIIKLLAEKGGLSFSEIKTTLNISTGSIYHHLYALEDFIEQDSKKRYMLNERGKKLYDILRRGEFRSVSYEDDVKENHLSKYFSYLSGSLVYLEISQNKIFAIITLISLLLLGSFVFYLAQLEPRIVFLSEASSGPFLNYLISFLISCFSVYAISELTSGLFLKKKPFSLALMSSIFFSYLPLILFALIWRSTEEFLVDNHLLASLIFLVFQSLYFLFLVRALQISKGLSLKDSLIIALFSFYVSFTYLLILEF